MRTLWGFLLSLMCVVLVSGCITSSTPSSDDVTVTAGDSLTFEIEIRGSSSTISWSLDGTVISGATSLAYTYTPGESDIGEHTLTVTETPSDGRTDSMTWTVTVTSEGDDPDPGDDDFAESVAESVSTYDADDVVGNHTFAYTIAVNFSQNTVKLSSGSAQTITSSGVTPLTVGGNSVVVSETTYGITIDSTVDEYVKYELSGNLSGTLIVESESPYQLYCNSVRISGGSGPAIDLESDQKVYIVTASGTSNTFSDTSSRDDEMDMKSAFYGKGPMIFSGDGALTVTANYKHGMFSKDYIRVRGGELNVNVSARDAIRANNAFIFDDGDLTMNGTGDETDDESKGIKVEGDESSDGAGKGYIVINGGYITATTVGKAITAGWDIDDDAETSTTSDDPDPYVEINHGILTLTTTGRSYENRNGASCSPEGIEGKTDVIINSGYMVINTTDDAINAGNSIEIAGGYLYCRSSDNDAIDANGPMTISGGVIVAIAAGEPEGPFDCDQATFSITGGTLVGIGGNTSRLYSRYCTQNVVVLGSITSGRTMALTSSAGDTAFAFTVPQSYNTMVISSPEIDSQTRYSVYSGGTATADEEFKGLFIGNLSYSGGSSSSTLTTTTTVTKIGGVYF